MKFNFSTRPLILILLIAFFTTIGLDSCQHSRYKRMIKKRRAGVSGTKKHRSEYQKKLRKRPISTHTPYYIKNKKNYRRRPWYD